MPTTLPPDEVLLEQTIAGAIKGVFLSVPVVSGYVNVYAQERYPDNEETDIQLSTIDDPVVGDRVKRTSIIEIGLPKVEEFEHTWDKGTQLNFTYPISFNLEVVDEWKDPGNVLEYKSSRALGMAVYMRSRRAFKFDRTLGFENCVHDYLQQEDAGTITDEETGGRLHILDWSLTVKCTGILV